MIRSSIVDLAAHCRDQLKSRGQQVAVAESCTGGLIGAYLSAVSGSSYIYKGSVVPYSNDMKTGLLGISPTLITQKGAVSNVVAAAMAEGVLKLTGAQIGIAATGIAGPGGGSTEKPVGTVYLAFAQLEGKTQVRQHYFEGNREEIRDATAYTLLKWLATCSNSAKLLA